jgi:hypothetical protein
VRLVSAGTFSTAAQIRFSQSIRQIKIRKNKIKYKIRAHTAISTFVSEFVCHPLNTKQS